MRLNLKETAKDGKKKQIQLEISDRLPPNIENPCSVTVSYQVKALDDYYLLELNSQADLDIMCMRCGDSFSTHFENQNEIAVCGSDSRAEELQDLYECIVANDFEIDLDEVITDELYLYSPAFHEEKKDCHLVID